MISKDEILEIFDKYNKDEITIATLGSHTALHILKGAKLEGFSTVCITMKGRDVPYKRFKVADKFIYVDKFSDIKNEEIQEKLRKLNAIVVPHGSFIAYCGLDNVENNFLVPMFGNRKILRWESERSLEGKLLREAGLRVPKKYESPEDIDTTVIVKFPGARGGRGYFIASSTEEFYKKAEDLINIGAYVKGSNPEIDRAIALIEPLRAFLKQNLSEAYSIEESVEQLRSIIEGSV